jgi:hypothetical protein
MILVINIELHEKQAHKQIDNTLESCDMHMYAQKFFNTMETFPWYASWIGNKKWFTINSLNFLSILASKYRSTNP